MNAMKLAVWVALVASSGSVRAQRMTLGLSPEVPVHGWFGLEGEAIALADVDGDEVDDLVTCLVAGSGDIWVALGDGVGGYGRSARWATGRTPKQTVAWGDVDGDGDDDLIAFTQKDSADVLVSLSTRSGLGPATKWHEWFAPAGESPRVGDFNGDGRADIATFLTSGAVFVATSTGAAFSGWGVRWASGFSGVGDVVGTGDFDGDGEDDIVAVTAGTPTRIKIARSNGSSAFGAAMTWVTSVAGGRGAHAPLFGDMNGDGLGDIAFFIGDQLVVYASTGTGLVREAWSTRQPVAGHTFRLGRADRDDKRDLFRFTPVADAGDSSSLGDVYLRRTQRPAERWATPAQATAFSMGTLRTVTPALGERPLLVVLARDPNQPAFAHPAAWYAELAFGPANPAAPLVAGGRNMRSYFQKASGGAFTWSNAGTIGPLTIAGFAALNEAGRIQAVVNALGAARFDFAPFDSNGDGDVTPNELQLAIVDVVTDVGGANRGAACVRPPNNVKRVCAAPTVLVGHRVSVGTFEHELVHAAGVPFELYGIDMFYGSSVMQATSGAWDDMASILPGPYERMRLGWLQPVLVPADSPSATYALDPAQVTDDAPPLIVYDERAGTRDYLMVEQRRARVPGDAIYDAGIVWGDGVRVWALTTTATGDPLVVDSWFGTRGKNVVAAIVGLDRSGDRAGGAIEGKVFGFGFPPAPSDGVITYAFSGYGANGARTAMQLEALDPAWCGDVQCVMRLRPDGGAPATFVDWSSFDEVYPGWGVILDGVFGDPRTLALVMQRIVDARVEAEIPLAVSRWSPRQVIAQVPFGTPPGTYRVRARDPAPTASGRFAYGSWVGVRVLQ